MNDDNDSWARETFGAATLERAVESRFAQIVRGGRRRRAARAAALTVVAVAIVTVVPIVVLTGRDTHSHGDGPAASAVTSDSRTSPIAATRTASAALTAEPGPAVSDAPPAPVLPPQTPAGAPIVLHAGTDSAQPSTVSLNLAVLAGGSVHIYAGAGGKAVGALFAATANCTAGGVSNDAEGATYVQLFGGCQGIRRVPSHGPAADLPYPSTVDTQWAMTDAGRRVELTMQIGPDFLTTLSWYDVGTTLDSPTARTSTAYEMFDPRLDPTGRYVVVSRGGPKGDSPLVHEQVETYLIPWGATWAGARRVVAPDGASCTVEDGGWVDSAKVGVPTSRIFRVLGLVEACDEPAGATFRPLLVDADTGAVLYRGDLIPNPTTATRTWKPGVTWAPDGTMLVDVQTAGDPSVQWYVVNATGVVSVPPIRGCTSKNSNQQTCVTAVSWTSAGVN